METTAYAHRVALDIPYEKAVKLATEKLAEQGFGLLSEDRLESRS